MLTYAIENLWATPLRTNRANTNAYDGLPNWFLIEHGIELDDAVNIRQRHFERLANGNYNRFRKVTIDVLGRPKYR